MYLPWLLFARGWEIRSFKIVGVNDQMIAGDSQGTTLEQVISRNI